MLLISTHNIWFHGEIRNILCGYPLLSAAMLEYVCSHKQSVVSREGICNNNIYKKKYREDTIMYVECVF